jgi:putative transposase
VRCPEVHPSAELQPISVELRTETAWRNMRCKNDEFKCGEYFHLYNRSIDGSLLFPEPDDYLYFLNKFEPKTYKYPASVFAYCLMPNHFHFLMRQDSDEEIYKIFNDLNNSYVNHYNFKYRRKGSLYEGKLNHKHVKNDAYLIVLCQYIHCNPVKAGLVSRLENWKFSNYLEWIGKRNNGLYNDELMKASFGNAEMYEMQIRDYQKYVDDREFQKLLFD